MKSLYPLVPVANFLAFSMMLLVALTTRLRQSWNVGICVFSSWIACLTLLNVVQTIVWRGTADTSIAPVFCDISIHIQVGAVAAVPACALIIARCLYNIIRNPTINSEDTGERRRDLLISLFLALGLPSIMNALYYLVQNSRFQVWEQYGCTFSWQPSGLAIIILGIFPMLLFIASAVYMACVIAALWKHKRSMDSVFGSRIRTAITRGVYLRVFAFGIVLLCLSGVSIGNLFPLPSEFYPGWAVIHDHWTPTSVSAEEWQAEALSRLNVYWNEWINVGIAAVTFGLFGFTKDARDTYMHAFHMLLGGVNKLRLSSSQSVLPLAHGNKPSRTRHIPSLNITQAGSSYADELAVSSNSVAIEIAVAVEKRTDGDTESQIESEYEREEEDGKAGMVI